MSSVARRIGEMLAQELRRLSEGKVISSDDASAGCITSGPPVIVNYDGDHIIKGRLAVRR